MDEKSSQPNWVQENTYSNTISTARNEYPYQRTQEVLASSI